jgi:hypothetical protein
MITYNPPPNGSYAPRLLAPLGSIWLPDREALPIGNLFSIQRSGSMVTLSPPVGGTRKTKLNSQLLDCDHILQDGDFIQHGHMTYIFQSDPVAARKQRLQTIPELHTMNLMPSAKLRERIDLGRTGISVDRGMTYIPWDQIVTLEFQYGQSQLPLLDWTSIQLAILRVGAAKRAKLGLRLKKQEFSELMDWFRLVLPFDLSVYDPEDHYGGNYIRSLLPDAYRAAVYEKILLPAEKGERSLPASVSVISGFSSVRNSGYLMGGGCLVVLALALILGLATDNEPLRNLALVFFLIFAVTLFGSFAQSRRK